MTARVVVVAHREAMVAEGLAAALATYPGIVPLGAATSAPDAERLGERADAVALDGDLPGSKAAARRLRRTGVRVVFLGTCPRGEEGVRVSTADPVSSLAAALVPGLPTSADAGAVAALTRRQREIMALVAGGLAAKQVARKLGISPKTVEHHKTKIFAKLGVPNQTAAVSLVRANGDGGFPRLARHSEGS